MFSLIFFVQQSKRLLAVGWIVTASRLDGQMLLLDFLPLCPLPLEAGWVHGVEHQRQWGQNLVRDDDDDNDDDDDDLNRFSTTISLFLKHREKNFSTTPRMLPTTMCVIPLAAVTQSFKPKGNKEQEKKKGPPLLSFIHFVGSSFTLCLVTKPSLRPKRDRRHTPEQKKEKNKTKQNHGWIENASCIKKLFVDLLKILVCSTTQKHSSNNKPNRSVNSTLLTCHVTISCMHAYLPNPNEVSKKKTSSNPLTSSLSVTYLFPFFPTTTHTRTKKNGFPSSLNRERKENVCRHKNPDWIVNCYHWWPYFLYYKAYYTIRWGGWIE
jgi:hypothetical protein